MQVTGNQEAGAVKTQEEFELVLRELIEDINLQGLEKKLDTTCKSYAAAMGTVIGGYKREEPNVFQARDYTYPEGVNIETSRTRREAGAPVPIEHGTPSRKEILGELEDQTWITHRLNLGGMPVEICLNDEYGADLLPGIQALMGGEAIDDLPSKAAPVMKLYFGVSDEIMRGDERRMFAHPDKKFLGMMIADIRGKNPRTGEDIEEGDKNYHFNHYFGYEKKSLLSLKNMWMLMLSATTQKQYYLDQMSQESDPKERQRRQAQINALKAGMPDQLQPLQTKLSNFLENDPEVFEQKLPRVQIPEISYDIESPDFDPTRYAFLPVHGAFYTVEYTNTAGRACSKNLMFPGDSGVGKSEVMRALMEQGIKVDDILADDMLYVIADRQTAQMYAVGDEGGAFTKTDDISGKMKAMSDTPLVGYNAFEETKNRRVVESGIAKPLEPKKVEGIVELINVEKKEEGEPRVEKATLEETVENWIQGPYRKSSSVEGGGVKAGSDDVPFWNEFGVPHLAGTQKFLVEEILARTPEPTWANGNGNREAIVENIEAERKKLFTAVVHTHHSGDQDKLEETFQKVAVELAEFLRQEG